MPHCVMAGGAILAWPRNPPNKPQDQPRTFKGCPNVSTSLPWTSLSFWFDLSVGRYSESSSAWALHLGPMSSPPKPNPLLSCALPSSSFWLVDLEQHEAETGSGTRFLADDFHEIRRLHSKSTPGWATSNHR